MGNATFPCGDPTPTKKGLRSVSKVYGQLFEPPGSPGGGDVISICKSPADVGVGVTVPDFREVDSGVW